jgi:hypothetical protein
MVKEPSTEEIARWDRWFAVETNNRAWTLAEQPARTPALAHAVLAHAASAAGDGALYSKEYALAKTLGEAISDAGDWEIFERTFSQLPVPQGCFCLGGHRTRAIYRSHHSARLTFALVSPYSPPRR